ncbi:MAG: hypothetical protein AAGI46_12755 [Planctomycetota bacterium]
MPDTDNRSPDDVIASMADEAIDRMLGEGLPSEPALPQPALSDDASDDVLDALLAGDSAKTDDTVAADEPGDAIAAAVASELAEDGMMPGEDDGLPAIPKLNESEERFDGISADGAMEDRPTGSIDRAVSSTPFWFGPLAWLARPLDKAGDDVRNAVGKIGLVTTVNAVAVIAFVVIRG